MFFHVIELQKSNNLRDLTGYISYLIDITFSGPVIADQSIFFKRFTSLSEIGIAVSSYNDIIPSR